MRCPLERMRDREAPVRRRNKVRLPRGKYISQYIDSRLLHIPEKILDEI